MAHKGPLVPSINGYDNAANVRFLIKQGRQVIASYQFQERQNALLGAFLSRELNPDSPSTHDIGLREFQLGLVGAFHIESTVLALTNYEIEDAELATEAEKAIIEFASTAARMYEYLGYYSRHSDTPHIVNLFIHAMFNYSLAVQTARGTTDQLKEKAEKLLDMQRLYQPDSQDIFERFVTRCEDVFLLFASRQFGKLLNLRSAVRTLYQELASGTGRVSPHLQHPVNFARLETYHELSEAVFAFALAMQFGNLGEYEAILRRVSEMRQYAIENGYSSDLWLAEHIQLEIERTYQNSTWVHFQDHDELFPPGYLENLAVHRGIFELWSAQTYAVKDCGLLQGSGQVGITLPPQSGSTFLAELIIANFLHTKAGRVVYIAHSAKDALDLRRRLEQSYRSDDRTSLYSVSVVWGGYKVSPADRQCFRNSDVLIASLDKFDTFMRQEPQLLSGIGLFVLDNLHLLKEHYLGQGVTYEFIIMRLKAKWPSKRIVWIGNQISDVEIATRWIPGNTFTLVSPDERFLSGHWQPTETFNIICDPRGREVIYSSGLTVDYRTDERMRDRHEATIEMALAYARLFGNAVITITQARRVEKITAKLAEAIEILQGTSANDDVFFKAIPREETQKVWKAFGLSPDDELQLLLLRCLNLGIAFYTSRLPSAVRRLIEDWFKGGYLRIVVGTLAFIENARVPVHAIIFPYWQYNPISVDPNDPTNRWPSPMSSNLFLSLASKTRQPEYWAEGHVIVISDKKDNEAEADQEREKIQTRYTEPREEYLALDSTLNVVIARIDREGWTFEDVRRFESQLVAFLKDGNYYDAQHQRLAELSLFNLRSPGPTALAGTIHTTFERLSNGRRETRALEAGSPYRVTRFGVRMTWSGLAYDTCVRLFDYLEDHLSSLSDTLTEFRDEDRRPCRDSFGFCLETIFRSIEAFSAMQIGKWPKMPDFNDNKLELILDWLLTDATLVELAKKHWSVRWDDARWVRFQDVFEIPREEWTDENHQAVDEALLSLSDLCQRVFQNIGSEVLNGFNEILNYLAYETDIGRGVTFSPEVALLSVYLKYRTTNPILCYLADIGIAETSVGRELLELFSQSYEITYEPKTDWKHFVSWTNGLQEEHIVRTLKPEQVGLVVRSIQRHKRLTYSNSSPR